MISFSFFDLQNEKKIMSSAQLAVCFESSSSCDIQTTILDRVLFPKQSCRWNRDYVIKGNQNYLNKDENSAGRRA
jgi:hypothetical protein